MSKVVSMGECLIDFIPSSETEYKANPGGAPANVCACVSKLGGEGYYLGRVSTDSFGGFLMDEMEKSGIRLDYVTRDDIHKTTLAFVTLKNGERSFSFYRDDTADLNFDAQDVNSNMFSKGDILHFCSLGLASSTSRKAHAKAIMLAEKNGGIVSFDVNMRETLWPSRKEMLDAIVGFMPYADIIKMSQEELAILSPEEDIKRIFAIADKASLMFITKGEEGSTVYSRDLNNYSVVAHKCDVVDTTGAGDAYIGAILYKLSKGEAELSVENMKDAMQFASVVSSLVCSSKGALASMPTLQKVKEIL